MCIGLAQQFCFLKILTLIFGIFRFISFRFVYKIFACFALQRNKQNYFFLSLFRLAHFRFRFAWKLNEGTPCSTFRHKISHIKFSYNNISVHKIFFYLQVYLRKYVFQRSRQFSYSSQLGRRGALSKKYMERKKCRAVEHNTGWSGTVMPN